MSDITKKISSILEEGKDQTVYLVYDFEDTSLKSLGYVSAVFSDRTKAEEYKKRIKGSHLRTFRIM